jgi:gliding motility-associated-like protein
MQTFYSLPYRKKLIKRVLSPCLFLLLSFCIVPATGYATHTITPFASQTVCVSSGYTNIGNFSLNEGAIADFAVQSGTTMTLTLPAGFAFNPGIGTVGFTAGRNITVLTYTISASNIAFTTTVTGVTKTDAITFTGLQVQAIVAGSGNLARTAGTFSVDGSAGIPTSLESFGNLATFAPMVYNYSSVNQYSTANIDKNCTVSSNPILEIAINVSTSDTCVALISQFNFNTAGDAGYSQNPLTNITKAEVYYAGQTQGFSYANFFGSVTNPNGAFTISGNQFLELGAGTYYFYLSYDVPASANVGDGLDASLTSFLYGGTSVTDMSTPNPTGIRTIAAGTCPVSPDSPNPPSNIQTITKGSLIIPMDNAHQDLYGGYAFNVRAYGLVHSLLMNDVPVKWVIKSGKIKDSSDFSANVTRVYPTPSLTTSTTEYFRAGEFVVDSFYLDHSFYSGGKTATQVITAFAQWKVAIYKLNADVNVDVRYTLNHRPKIAVFSNGGNEAIQKAMLDTAKVTNYTIESAGAFTGLADCFTFCSEAHWDYATNPNTAPVQNVVDFVTEGGNFLAQCAGIDLYENHQPLGEHFQTTKGVLFQNVLETNTYSNPDMAFNQFQGAVKSETGTIASFELAASSSYKPETYYGISAPLATNTIVASGAHLSDPDSVGSNVFYLGGHQYPATGGLTDINGARMYLNASLVPAHRPTAFALSPGANTTICSGHSTTLGGSPTGPAGSVYNWLPAGSLNSSSIANPVASPTVTTTYTVTAMNGSCSGGPSFVTITVNPTPLVTSASTATICSGAVVTIPLSSSIASTYSWIATDNPNTTGESISTQTTTTLNNTIINTTTTVQTVIYTVTPTSTLGSCVGTPQLISITVNPAPTMTSANTATLCSGATVSIPLSSNIAASYTWIATDNPNTTGESITAQTTNTLSNTITDNTVSIQSVIYTVTPAGAGCTGAPQTVTVTINPTPVTPTVTSNSPLCVGATLTLSVSTVAGASYNWTGPNTFTASTQNPSIAGTTTLASGTYSIIATVAGCTSAVASTSVSVAPAPVAPTAGSNSPICAGQVLNLSASAIAGATYNWTGPNTFTASTQNPSIAVSTTASSGTYSVSATVAGCAGPAGIISVTVNPIPATPTVSSNAPLCAGSTLNLTASTISGASYSWAGPNTFTASIQNPSIAATTTAGSGTYTVTTSLNGCTSSSGTIGVTVNPVPAAPTAGSNSPLCISNTLSLTASNVAGASYSWTGPNTFTSSVQNPSIAGTTTVASGTYSVTTTAAGCTSAISTVSVVVNSPPATPAAGSNSPVCSGFALNLTAGTITGASYSWTGPNTFTASTQNPSIAVTTTVASGSYSVTATVPGCATSPSGTVSVLVNPTPVTPTVGANTPLCAGSTLNLTAGAIAGASYSWTGPNTFTSSIQNPSIAVTTTLASGTYSVIATVAGCASAKGTVAVTVNPIPVAPIAGSNSPVCQGTTLNLTANTIAGATYSWTDPNAFTSSVQNPSITNVPVTSDGTYSVTATVAGCTSLPGTVTATINPTPAAPTAGSNAPLCVGSTLSLTATAIAGASYSWTGPNTFTSSTQNPSITGTTTLASGTYSVIASVSGCAGPAGTTSVSVAPAPLAPTAGSNSAICAGQTLNLTASTIAGATYNWAGPNTFTSSVQNPSIVATTTASSGTYSVNATVSGCAGPAGIISVTVNPAPVAPTAGSNSPLCVGTTLNLTASNIATASYSWTGPNTFTSLIQNPSIVGTTTLASGTYSVIATVAGCPGATGTVSVTVNPIPAAPTAGSNSPLCVSGTLSLTASAIAGATYNWTGPNTFTSSLQNPSIAGTTTLSGGTYTINATVAGCTSANATISIIVNPPPAAPAAGSNAPLCAGSTLNLTANTIANASYNWTGPNTFTSSTQNPGIAGTTTVASGTYSVTATVPGCTVSPVGTVSVLVNPIPVAPTAGSNSPICAGSTLNLTASNTASASYSWTGPNTFTSSTQNPSIAAATALASGTYSVSATVAGCTSAKGTVSVTVNPIPVAPTAGSNSPVCVGGTLNLTAGAIGGASYNWTGPNTFTSSIQNPSIAGTTTMTGGTYSVNATVAGCTSTASTVSVIVNPPPAAPSAGSNSAICAGSALNLTAGTIANATYNWTGPNTFTSSTQNPSIAITTIAASGTYSVTATVPGCTVSPVGTVSVLVNPIPAKPTAGSNSPLCVGSTLNLTASTIATASYSWTGPNTFTSSIQNPSITGTTTITSGTYSVSATVNGCTGADGTVNVVVNPIPAAPTAGSNSPICQGATLNLTAANMAGATYSWAGPNTFTASLQNPSIANTTTLASGTYSVTASVLGCISPAGIISVTVNPTPAAPIAGNDSPICAGSTLNLTAGAIAGASYNWTGPNTFTASTQNPSIASTTTLASGTYSVAASVLGCVGPVGITSVTVNPIPVAPTAGSNAPLCVGQNLNLTCAAVTGASYNWSGPNTFTSSVQNPSITNAGVTNAGTYSVDVTVNGCTSMNGTVSVIISPPPVTPVAGSNSAVCSGQALNLTASTIAGASYSWTGPNTFTSSIQNPSIASTTTLASGTYTVIATIGICSSPQGTVAVVVNQTPIAPTGGSNSPLCVGSSINLTASTLTGASYSWTGPNTFTSSTQNPSLINSTTTESGTYSVTASVTGCTGPAGIVNVIVNPIPASPTAGSNSPVCSGQTLSLTSNTVTGASYSWTGPNTFTSSVQNPSIVSTTTLASGTYSVTVTVDGCTGAAGTATVVVNQTPAAPTARSNSPVCEGSDLNLSASTITGASYNWTGPNTFTSSLQNPDIANAPIAASGTYSVTSTITGCTSVEGTVSATVYPIPAVPIAGSNAPLCVGQTLNLTCATVAGANYNWAGPNTFTSSTQNPSVSNVTVTEAGTYSVNTTVNGCTSPTVSVSVLISPPPATPIAGSNSPVCSGQTLNLSAVTITGASYAWSGPNAFASSVQNPSISNATTSSSGIYSVTATIGNCASPVGTVSVLVNPTPAAPVAGSNSPLCVGSTLNLTASTIGGGIYNWAGPNTFTSSTQNPSITTITSAEAGTYSVNSTVSGCTSPDGTVTIVINSPAIVSAGSSQTVCANNANIILSGSSSTGAAQWSSSGTGSFTPNNTTLTATYTPSAGDISSGSTTLAISSLNNGACVPVTDQITITITPSPTVSASSNQTVCANNAAVTLNGSYAIAAGISWSTSGSGTFTPDNTTANAGYSPGTADITAGTITLTITSTGNGNCLAVSNSMLLTIMPAPVVHAGSDISVCVNNPNAALSGTSSTGSAQWSSSGTGTFTPNNTSLNATYNASAADIAGGTVILTLTTNNNANCLAVSDTTSIKYTASPTVSAGTSGVSVCANNAAITLSGTSSTGSGAWTTSGTGSFTPNNNTLHTVYNPSSADALSGTVTLTLTSTNNGGCIAVTSQQTETITPGPTAYAGNDTSVCGNNPNVLLNGSFTIASGIVWSSLGTGTFTPGNTNTHTTYIPSSTDTSAGSVKIILTTTGNANCKATTDTMFVTITDAPRLSAGANANVCLGSPDYILNGSSSTGSGIWATSGTGSFTPNNSTLNATYIPSTIDTSNKTVSLVLTSANNAGCNAVKDTMVIVYTNIPSVSASGSQTVCANNANIILSSSSSTGTGIWSTNGTGTFTPNNTSLNNTYMPSAADTASGNITLTISSTNGCTPVSKNISVIITHAPDVHAGNDVAVCVNNPNVTLNGTIGGATSTGTWSTNGTGTFTPNNSTLNATYIPSNDDTTTGSVKVILTSTGNGNCLATTDTLKIAYTHAPVVHAGNDVSICANNAVSLNGSISGGNGTGIWTTTNGSGTFTPHDTTLHALYNTINADTNATSVMLILTSTNNGGCLASSDTVLVTVNPGPVVNAGADQSMCANNISIALSGTIAVASGGQWSSSGTGTFTPNNTSLNAAYHPSIAEINSGSIALILSSTGNGLCQAVSDSMKVHLTPAPLVNAGPDIFICNSGMTAVLNGSISGGSTKGQWTTLGSGTFAPNDSTLSATYNLSNADTTAGSVKLVLASTNNAGCLAVSDTILIKLNSAPIVFAGNDTTVCGNTNSISLNGSISGGIKGEWASHGNGTFAPNDSALHGSYTPGAADISAGFVSLILTSNKNGQCPSSIDSMRITFFAPTIVSAGSNIPVCKGTMVAQLNGSISGGTTTGHWATSGNGTFTPNDSTLNAVYHLSNADTTAGSITLTLTSTHNGSCSAVTNTVVIFMNSAPVASAGNDTSVCANNGRVPLHGAVTGGSGTGVWTSNGAGVFTPNDSTLQASYTPGANDISVTLTLSSIKNGSCPQAIDSMKISITPAPLVHVGNDLFICSSTKTVSLNGTVSGGASTGVWTSSGNGNFSPSIDSLHAIYTVSSADSSAGSVHLILTSTNNGTCHAAKDTLSVIITTETSASAGNDTSLCAGSDSLLLAGIIIGGSQGQWTSSGTGTFTPSNTTLHAAYTPSASDISKGSIILTLTPTNGCQPKADSLKVSIQPTALVNAGTDVSICSSTKTLSLNGTVSGGASTGAWTSSGSGNFSPSPDSLKGIYTISSADSSAGSAHLILTSTNNGSCGAVKDTMIVTLSNSTSALAGNDISTCANNASIALTGTISGGSGQGVWTSSGTGTFSPSGTALNTTYIPSTTDISAGDFILTLTPVNGCQPKADSLKVSISPAPTVNAGSDMHVCGTSPIALSGTINAVPTGAIWTTNGTGTFTPNNTTLHNTYTESVTDLDTLQFILTTTGNGLCNAVSDTMLVYTNAKPVASFSVNNSCAGHLTSFTDNSTLNGGTINTWHWNFGTGDTTAVQNPSYTYTTSGVFQVSLVVSSGTSCSDSIKKTIHINPSPVATFTFTNTCLHDSIHFANNSTISSGSIHNWNWSLGDGSISSVQNPIHVYDSTKVYSITLTATSDSGCASSLTQTITMNPPPLAGFFPQSSCGALVVNFKDTSSVSLGNISSYNWVFGDGGTSTQENPSHTYPSSATYTVSLHTQTATGCANTATVIIHTGQAVSAQYIPAGGTYNTNQPIDFTNQSTGSTTYTWSFGDNTSISTASNPTHSFNLPGTYIVTLISTNGQGCSDTSRHDFTIHSGGYAIPTGFTPNGDGLNDYFFIRGGPFSQYELRVFNEWGQQIFMSNNQSEKWDGMFNGVAQPIGTYMYTFNGLLETENLKLSGEINIIR